MMKSRGRRIQRGASANPTGRFEPHAYVVFDDGWNSANDDDEPKLRTRITPEHARTVISSNDSPDVPFSKSINPYRGCEHGCVYCFARPTHAYLGLSPGLDFETQLRVKTNAAQALKDTWAAPSYQCEPFVIGANTDPYQPAERTYEVTRQLLQECLAARHPVGLITKSHHIQRDLDVLGELAAHNLVHVMISITTLERDLVRSLEPRAASPSRRLQTIERLAAVGVPVGVLVSPVIPALNDHELEGILEAAAMRGASGAGYAVLRLPGAVQQLFSEWLDIHYPDRAARVLSRVRQFHEGEIYRADFGHRMRGSGPHADLLATRFQNATRRLGLDTRSYVANLDATSFRRPGQLVLC